VLSILESRVFSEVVPGAVVGLPELCRSLLRQQRETWPMCRDGYASLAGVQTRSLGLHGHALHLQFNPGRMVSTGAKVDPATIRQRKCFLCVEHLPLEQQGIVYGSDLLILCNPAPIFPEHFTISHRVHREQRLASHVDTLLRLAADLAPEFSVFYNGPRCGASAPDHFHFQAAPLSAIPAVREAAGASAVSVCEIGAVRVSTIPGYGRTIATMRGIEAEAMVAAVKRFLAAWQRADGHAEEPMMNVIASQVDGVYQAVIFLRRKHRPEAFFREGDGQVLVSPAAVDIGGLVITPREREFTTLTSAAVASIFDEVSCGPEVLERIVEVL
jgi:hypothetical protein